MAEITQILRAYQTDTFKNGNTQQDGEITGNLWYTDFGGDNYCRTKIVSRGITTALGWSNGHASSGSLWFKNLEYYTDIKPSAIKSVTLNMTMRADSYMEADMDNPFKTNDVVYCKLRFTPQSTGKIIYSTEYLKVANLTDQMFSIPIQASNLMDFVYNHEPIVQIYILRRYSLRINNSNSIFASNPYLSVVYERAEEAPIFTGVTVTPNETTVGQNVIVTATLK